MTHRTGHTPKPPSPRVLQTLPQAIRDQLTEQAIRATRAIDTLLGDADRAWSTEQVQAVAQLMSARNGTLALVSKSTGREE